MKRYKIIKFIFRYSLFRSKRNNAVTIPVEYQGSFLEQYAVVKPFLSGMFFLLFLVVSPSNAQQDLKGVDQQSTDQERVEPKVDILVAESTQRQVSRQLRADLDAQFERIQLLKKTENAYSDKLGEEYLNYVFLLKQAGELDEARKVLIDALHISKVNDGVYGIEQRPILRVLFEVDSLLGNSEKMEEDFAKIEWLEIKNSNHIGTYSLDIMVKLGHHFLDRYSIQTSRSDASLALVDSAIRYFSGAINRYGFKTDDVLLMPYGELLEVYFYRIKLLEGLDVRQRTPAFGERNRDRFFQRESSQFSRFNSEEERKKTIFFIQQYSNQYLERAKKEKNKTQIVLALLATADWNLLLKREDRAAHYYKLAWEEAQKLTVDDPLRLSFNQPVRLPAFNHSYKNDEARREGATYGYFPVTFSVGSNGKVDQVVKNVLGASNQKNANRARRIIKRTKFRPVILDGEMVATDQHEEQVRVLISKK